VRASLGVYPMNTSLAEAAICWLEALDPPEEIRGCQSSGRPVLRLVAEMVYETVVPLPVTW
jgi:hypothetical protein